MNEAQVRVILKSFESADEMRLLQKGRFDVVHLDGMTIGRATYDPGWKWSEHVGPEVGARRCEVEHVGLVLSDTATAAFLNCTPVSFFTFRRCHMTAGLSATKLTFRSTSSEPITTPNRPI